MARFAHVIVIDADDADKGYEQIAQYLNIPGVRYVGRPIEVPIVEQYGTIGLTLEVENEARYYGSSGVGS